MKKITRLVGFVVCCVAVMNAVAFQPPALLATGNQAPAQAAAPPSWWNTHPRVMLSEKKIRHIQSTRSVSPVLDSLYTYQLREAEQVISKPLPVYRQTTDPEQLWQRSVGDELSIVAMAFALTGEQKYLDAVTARLAEVMKYPTWGVDGTDLAAGHLLFGVASVYDWCYESLSPDARIRIEKEILKRGALVYQSLLPGGSWIKDVYLQNHLWVTQAGLLAAAVAIIDKHPEAQPWIDIVRDKQKKTFALLGTDGASHEGVGYWTYGVEYLLRYMDIVRDLYGEDHFKNEWFQKTARYYLALSLPRSAWARNLEITDIADSPRKSWYGPNHILRKLAAEYGDPYAQFRAEELDTRFRRYPGSEWQGLLWYNERQRALSLASYPVLSHFDDMGIVSSRTSWSGNESMLVFKCAPPLGHSILKHVNSFGSAGHVHPDAGSFTLFANGRFLIRNPGYSMKRTSYQNTLLVNGQGQTGEQRWFRYTPTPSSVLREANTKLVVVSHTPDADYFVANAATAYDASAGIKVFRRHLIFLKAISALLIFDEMELEKAGNLTLTFHPEVPARTTGKSQILISQDSLASLFIQSLSPGAEVVVSEADTILSTGGKPYFLPSVKVMYSNVEQMKSVVLMNWTDGNVNALPLDVKYKVNKGSVHSIAVSKKGTLLFDPVKQTIHWRPVKTEK